MTGDAFKTGRDWFDAFLQKQASVAFNCLWLAFAIGQAGAAMEFADKEITAQMLNQYEQDISDLETSAAQLLDTCRQLLANARENLS